MWNYIFVFLFLFGPLIIIFLFEPVLYYSEHHIENSHGIPGYTLHYYGDLSYKRDGKDNNTFLSVVIPAYNEENRIMPMLTTTMDYLLDWSYHHKLYFEIIIVDDGSIDKTSRLILDYLKLHKDKMRFINLKNNVGKGAALTMGVMESIGEYVLIADADGATNIEDIDKLLPILQDIEINHHILTSESFGMVIGSRAHLEKDSISKRSFIRTILMKGFHLYVQLFITNHIYDTQCGFKLFTKSTAKLLFHNLHLYRWAFDTEIIYLAEKYNIPIKEVPVNWHEVDGSKLITNKFDVITTSLAMARDILCMRLSYLFYFWKYPNFIPINI